jgi:leucyl/phenylalanyl-tRNA---protein transferase
VTVYRLDHRLVFPRPELADDDGLLAVGGDLRPERLLLAYSNGIFPWYSEGLPILWHSPDPRTVLVVGERHVPRSLAKTIRRGRYRITFDTAFDQVVAACGETPRPGQTGTWITEEMKQAYARLHEQGYAHSVEAWEEDRLCGGLYGVSLGAAFFGESMFAHAEDASKVAFVRLLESLEGWGIELVDCQVHTEHLARFGAVEWPRKRFLAELARLLDKPTRRGPWAVTDSRPRGS